jgi:hypothetical protein
LLSIAGGNSLAAFALQISMQALYGTLRTMQMITFPSLLRVPFQPHTSLFFQITIEFAQADIFDGQGYYKEWFTFVETPSLNDKFSEMGIQTSTFILNSGSFFFFAALYILQHCLKKCANMFGTCFASSEKVRNFCILFGTHKTPLGSKLIKLFLEMYFEIAIAVLIQLNVLIKARSFGISYWKFFSSPIEIANMSLTLFFMIALLWFPYSGYKRIKK